LPHVLFIVHIPSLKIHSILTHRIPIVQVCWRTISHGQNLIMDNVLDDYDDDASFWELALICQSSSHLYLWCSDICAFVAFPKLNTSVSSDTAADMDSIKTDGPFWVRDL
jgi:hypothetical protein